MLDICLVGVLATTVILFITLIKSTLCSCSGFHIDFHWCDLRPEFVIFNIPDACVFIMFLPFLVACSVSSPNLALLLNFFLFFFCNSVESDTWTHFHCLQIHNLRQAVSIVCVHRLSEKRTVHITNVLLVQSIIWTHLWLDHNVYPLYRQNVYLQM